MIPPGIGRRYHVECRPRFASRSPLPSPRLCGPAALGGQCNTLSMWPQPPSAGDATPTAPTPRTSNPPPTTARNARNRQSRPSHEIRSAHRQTTKVLLPYSMRFFFSTIYCSPAQLSRAARAVGGPSLGTNPKNRIIRKKLRRAHSPQKNSDHPARYKIEAQAHRAPATQTLSPREKG